MRTKRNSHWRWDTSVEISGLFTEKKRNKKEQKTQIRVSYFAESYPSSDCFAPSIGLLANSLEFEGFKGANKTNSYKINESDVK